MVSKATIITDTFKYLLQIIGLAVFHNYYYYVIAVLLTQIINNIVTAYISKRFFPSFSPAGKLAKDDVKKINNKIKDLFTSKEGNILLDNLNATILSTEVSSIICGNSQLRYAIPKGRQYSNVNRIY